MDLRETENGVNQETHWYYQSKLIPLKKFTAKLIKESNEPITLIDIGSGTGFFSISLEKEFASNVKEVLLVDINYTDEEVNSTQELKIKKLKALPEEMHNSLIIMMDVLEHSERDDEFLKEVTSKNIGQNHYFITVPAFMSLWSYHDEYLLHFRRYKLSQLSKLAEGCGIKIVNKYYLYFSLFPAAWIYRRLFSANNNKGKSDMSQPSSFINGLLKSYFSAEHIFRKFNRCFGLTCCIEGQTSN